MKNLINLTDAEISHVDGGGKISGQLGMYAAGAGFAAAVTMEVPPAAAACGFVAGTLALAAAGADYMGW